MHKPSDELEIDGIEYDLAKMNDINYVLVKMNEYLNKIGHTKAIKSQKFIRHLHIFIALKLQEELEIPMEDIHFEVRLRNKTVDIGVVQEGRLKVAISLKSQSSSQRKNFTNHIDALRGEVTSLKTYYPRLIVGLVYLLKRRDGSDNDYDCLDYYMVNIPKKLTPFISYGGKDRFDTGCIIIWDIEGGKVNFENNNITEAYSLRNMIKDVKGLYDGKIKSQFSLDLLSKNFKNFLESTKRKDK